MRERPEGLDVRLIGRQLRQRQPSYHLHVSKSMELSNLCQVAFAKTSDVYGGVGRDSAARVGACRFPTRHDDCWSNIGQRRNEPAEERRCGGRSNPLAVNGCGGWIYAECYTTPDICWIDMKSLRHVAGLTLRVVE